MSSLAASLLALSLPMVALASPLIPRVSTPFRFACRETLTDTASILAIRVDCLLELADLLCRVLLVFFGEFEGQAQSRALQAIKGEMGLVASPSPIFLGYMLIVHDNQVSNACCTNSPGGHLLLTQVSVRYPLLYGRARVPANVAHPPSSIRRSSSTLTLPLVQVMPGRFTGSGLTIATELFV